MTVRIQWSMFAEEDPWTPIVTQNITDKTYLDPNSMGETLASFCAADWFDNDEWNKHFLPDQNRAVVWVQIHAPLQRSGFYLIHLERVTKAMSESKRKTDPRNS